MSIPFTVTSFAILAAALQRIQEAWEVTGKWCWCFGRIKCHGPKIPLRPWGRIDYDPSKFRWIFTNEYSIISQQAWNFTSSRASLKGTVSLFKGETDLIDMSFVSDTSSEATIRGVAIVALNANSLLLCLPPSLCLHVFPVNNKTKSE